MYSIGVIKMGIKEDRKEVETLRELLERKRVVERKSAELEILELDYKIVVAKEKLVSAKKVVAKKGKL